LADSDFADAVKEQFGDFDGWKARIETLAATRGVGWVMTLREHGSGKLHNFWVDLHHLHMPADSQLMFVLDVWEHAFMIDFTPAQKADYVKTVLENVDWATVEKRYAVGEALEAAHA
jgi:superoxide dismutase, Fe-Mn family